MFAKQLLQFIAVCSLVLSSSFVHAQWMLDKENSSVDFISIKKSKIGEVHHFTDISGSINDQGQLNFTIALDSVETLIPIRNERMRELLFETARFAAAKVTASVDAKALAALPAGKMMDETVEVSLTLHGKTTEFSAALKAVKLSGNKLLVMTTKPFVLNTEDYDLVAGVEKLREVAKLPSISFAVPATVNLVFYQQ